MRSHRDTRGVDGRLGLPLAALPRLPRRAASAFLRRLNGCLGLGGLRRELAARHPARCSVLDLELVEHRGLAHRLALSALATLPTLATLATLPLCGHLGHLESGCGGHSAFFVNVNM